MERSGSVNACIHICRILFPSRGAPFLRSRCVYPLGAYHILTMDSKGRIHKVQGFAFGISRIHASMHAFVHFSECVLAKGKCSLLLCYMWWLLLDFRKKGTVPDSWRLRRRQGACKHRAMPPMPVHELSSSRRSLRIEKEALVESGAYALRPAEYEVPCTYMLRCMHIMMYYL